MHRTENWLPLRGRWLRYFLTGVLILMGVVGTVRRWYRVQVARSFRLGDFVFEIFHDVGMGRSILDGPDCH